MLKLVVLFFAFVSLVANARYVQEVRPGFDIPCEGELCHQTVFCWRGARYADLNQLTRRVHAQVNFSHEADMCVDAEMDDALSLRSLLFGYNNDTAAIRLSNRIGSTRSWISSVIVNALVGGSHKGHGDGECHGKTCKVHFSPYGLSCIRLCAEHPPKDGHVMKADVRFAVESVLDTRSLTFWMLGLILASVAPSLAERPEMFYLTGGSFGVIFAVALLVLIVSRMATKSGPTKSQLGVAAFFQVGAVYARNAVFEFIKSYIDWIALYVILTFVSSLGLVHYFLKGEDGKIRLSSSLKDIVRVSLQLLASFLIAMPVTSARYRLITTGVVFGFQVLSHLRNGGLMKMLFSGRLPNSVRSGRKQTRIESVKKTVGRDRSPVRGEEEEANLSDEDVVYRPGSKPTTTTPQRPGSPPKALSGARYLTKEEYQRQGREYTDSEVRKLLTPVKAATEQEKSFLEWLQDNHARIQLSAAKVPPPDDLADYEDDEEDEEEEDDDDEVEGEGEGNEE